MAAKRKAKPAAPATRAAAEPWVNRYVEMYFDSAEATAARAQEKIEATGGDVQKCADALPLLTSVSDTLGSIQARIRARMTVGEAEYGVNPSDYGQYAEKYQKLGVREKELADAYVAKCLRERG